MKALPGRKFVGRRTNLDVEPEERSHVYELELIVDNKDRAILPGMFITARVVLEVRQNPVIPLFSVIPREEDKVVFVVEDGKASRRTIETGLILGSSLPEAEIEITGGLAAGDKLIVRGQKNVDDGDSVTINTVDNK